MGVKEVKYRDAPIDIEPLRKQIKVLGEEISDLKDRATILETEVEILKPKEIP